MDGTVTDQQSAAAVGADVTVVNLNTQATFKAKTDERGHWEVPSMPQASYRVSVSLKGFRTTVIENVVMDAGIPVTVNAKLEVGSVAETVEVTGAQELVQTTSATVASSLEKNQMTQLPMLSRNGLDMLMSLPGIQTGGVNRNSTINGLPSGAINITVDGLNTQDNTLKSSSTSSYFTYIPILQDSVEEVVLSGAAANADSTGEGAATVKFVTRSGTSQFHGGVFWQNRNTALTANSYFNTINHLPRSIVKLNQYGFHVGGPISIPKVMDTKNKLFFFTNVEFRKLPQSASFTRNVLTQDAANGYYSWGTSLGVVQGRVNVLSLAKAAGFNGTTDPTIAKTYSQILALAPNCGSLTPNIANNDDYNTLTCNYTTPGTDRRHFSMSRVDYNLNSRNQISITYSYNMYNAVPDVLNSVVPIYPGTGDILGTNIFTGQTSNRFMGTIALRSSITAHLTNAFQGGLNGGTVVFGAGASSPAAYAQWRGYIPSLYDAGISTETAPQRRNDPVKQLSDTMSYLKGQHMLTFGGDFAQINYWGQYFGSESFPTINMSSNPAGNSDPVHSGTTDVFGITSGGTMFAGAPGVNVTATQAQADTAAELYASLTGRVYSITRQVVENETSHQYGNQPLINRDQQRQFGLFIQDSWRLAPSFTLNYGVRFEQQEPMTNLSGIYTASTIQAVYGTSGIGKMFQPGASSGMTTVSGGAAWAPSLAAYVPLTSITEYKMPRNFNPNIGFAWQLPQAKGFFARLLGDHQGSSVLRAGFSIATIRENIAQLSSMYGSNPGLTIPASVDPNNYPQYFGAPGSVQFSQATLPVYPTPTAPTYPMTTTPTSSINAFDPNLKVGYVESWNVGFQREFARNNVIEVRYQGNHEVHGWRQVQVNEVNVFESGFLTDFANAYNNLLIARNGNINNTNTNNFANQGLPGQKALTILQTALSPSNLLNSSTYATYLRQNRPGALAGILYNNATYMNRLVAAGYPANLFVVNPSVASGGSWLVTDWGTSYWDAGVVEYRRRLASGLQIQSNFVWSKSLSDGSTGNSSVYAEPTTFRNLALDKIPSGFDIRKAVKLNFIYELPFGHGKPFLSGNTVLDKAFGGWQFTGIIRSQTGTPTELSSRSGMNTNSDGVVLMNMTTAQLQSMMHIVKTTGPASSSTWGGIGQVWWLPVSPSTATPGSTFVTNSQAAWDAASLGWGVLNTSAPYVSPQLAPGQFGYRVFLYGPTQNHLDFNLSKTTRFLKEKANLVIQANCLNCLNLTDFFLANVNPASSSFGLTTSAYSDISNTNDPGGRILEFVVRINF